MLDLSARDIAIIGYGDTKLARRSGRNVAELAGLAVKDLLARTGIDRREIDGFASTLAMSEGSNPFWTNLLAETLDLSVTWCQATDLGGAAAIGNIARAAMAIRAGVCEMVLCLCADAVSTEDLSFQRGHRTEFYDSIGYPGPVMAFGLLSSVYAERHGWPEEALAKLAVVQRAGGVRNPNACEILRTPITREDYLSSRVVCSPLRLLDCVMRCDGASAFLVTSTRRAREIDAVRMVHPIAYRELSNFDPERRAGDITLSGFSEIGPAVLADAELTPGDVGMFHPYDDFLIAVLLQLEQIGFCKRGQGGSYVLDNELGPEGNLPTNTGGGQISAGQPGLAGGGVNLVEALRQFFGDAESRQVPAPRNALLTGIGVVQYGRNWGCSNAMVLEQGT